MVGFKVLSPSSGLLLGPPTHSIAAIHTATSNEHGQVAVTGTEVQKHIQPSLCPSCLQSNPPPPFSVSGCLSLSPITLPVLVFDLQTLVGIMTTNQGWRWVITMWPTHPSWPFYSPHMMHLPDSFWEPTELHHKGFTHGSQGTAWIQW